MKKIIFIFSYVFLFHYGLSDVLANNNGCFERIIEGNVFSITGSKFGRIIYSLGKGIYELNPSLESSERPTSKLIVTSVHGDIQMASWAHGHLFYGSANDKHLRYISVEEPYRRKEFETQFEWITGLSLLQKSNDNSNAFIVALSHADALRIYDLDLGEPSFDLLSAKNFTQSIVGTRFFRQGGRDYLYVALEHKLVRYEFQFGKENPLDIKSENLKSFANISALEIIQLDENISGPIIAYGSTIRSAEMGFLHKRTESFNCKITRLGLFKGRNSEMLVAAETSNSGSNTPLSFWDLASSQKQSPDRYILDSELGTVRCFFGLEDGRLLIGTEKGLYVHTPFKPSEPPVLSLREDM